MEKENTNNNGKFYWLKLKRDFFKRHDIMVLESMPNGKEYSLFYLKLMLESIDHEGQLRFSEQIPYDANMLSAITNTNVDTVKSAVNILSQLGLLEVWDDQTIYMTEVEKMIGSASNSDVANRVRKCRENQKALQNVTNVKQICNESKSIELDKDIELDKIKDINIEKKDQSTSDFGVDKEKKVVQKHKYGKYKNILLTEEEYQKLLAMENGEDAIEYLSEYREYKGYKAKSDYLAIRKWVFDAMKEDAIKKDRINKIESNRMTDSEKHRLGVLTDSEMEQLNADNPDKCFDIYGRELGDVEM